MEEQICKDDESGLLYKTLANKLSNLNGILVDKSAVNKGLQVP